MSQFDFGVIDPLVRDGSWLADSLNQWRDALYSQHAGPAAPSYAAGIEGFLWADTAAGAAGTIMRQQLGGAVRELWRWNAATGEVQFAGGIDWDNITDLVWLKAVPTSLRTDGGIAIGGAAAVTAGYLLDVASAADHAKVRLYASGANKVPVLYLGSAVRAYQFYMGTDGTLRISDVNAAADRIIVNTSGQVGLGGVPTYPLEVITGAAADAWITTTRGGTAGNSGFAFRNSVRFWGIHVDASGECVINDFSGSGYRLRIQAGTYAGMIMNGPIYAMGDTNFGLFRGGGGGAPGDGRYFHAYTNNYIWWNGADSIWRIVVNGIERFNVQSNGDIYAWRLMGGPANAGQLRGHTNANAICFRWDGNYLYYRIDEAVERAISTGGAAIAGNATYINLEASALGAFGWAMRVDGGGYSGYFVATQQSDPALKINVRPAALDALAVVRGVEIIEYDFLPAGGAHVPLGFNAVTLQRQIPGMVFRPEGQYLHLNAPAGVPYLFRAVQQLEERLVSLERMVSYADHDHARCGDQGNHRAQGDV